MQFAFVLKFWLIKFCFLWYRLIKVLQFFIIFINCDIRAYFCRRTSTAISKFGFMWLKKGAGITKRLHYDGAVISWVSVAVISTYSQSLIWPFFVSTFSYFRLLIVLFDFHKWMYVLYFARQFCWIYYLLLLTSAAETICWLIEPLDCRIHFQNR